MTFSLPSFDVEFLEFFYVCARLNNPATELVDWINTLGSGHVETSYDSKRGLAWIIASANFKSADEDDDSSGDLPYFHFHISCALESFFDGAKDRTEPPHTHEQFGEFCQHFIGKQLNTVRVESQYVVPTASLPKPSVADLLGTNVTVGGRKVAIDSLSARFIDPQQLPIRIQWEQQKSGNAVVRLRATEHDLVATEDYLEKTEKSLDQMLHRFILETDGDEDA